MVVVVAPVAVVAVVFVVCVCRLVSLVCLFWLPPCLSFVAVRYTIDTAKVRVPDQDLTREICILWMWRLATPFRGCLLLSVLSVPFSPFLLFLVLLPAALAFACRPSSCYGLGSLLCM